MTQFRRIIVAGATGKQGGALIASLVSKPTAQFEIYALTRDKTSRSAQALAKQPNVRVIQGDFANPAAVFAQVEKPWGLFSVTMPMNAKLEEQQGKAMTAAALAAGVKHIVFTSAERGGQERSQTDPTPVPHFASKFKIEQDIKAKAPASGTTWTFLLPVSFFENLTLDFFGKGFVAMWRLNGMDRRMQMISTVDVGKVAAEAFLNFDSEAYRNQSISLAGDELSPADAAKIFKEVVGQEIPSTFGIVGRGLRLALHEQLGIMFNWIRDVGFGVNMAQMKRQYPFTKDFRAWLSEESVWKKA